MKGIFALIVAGLVVAGGCVAGAGSFPTADMLLTEGSVQSDANAAALNRGRAILLTDCTSCHRLFKPGELTPREWNALARDMGARSGLSAGQTADLLLYLRAASRRKTE